MKKILLHTAILLTLIFSITNVVAQNKTASTIKWSLLASLPQPVKGQTSGLAGAFTGAGGQTMWIAGGANFSNGLPWEGGTKILHDTIFFFHRKGQHAALLPQRKRLPFAVAYGVSIPIQNGVACLGGQTNTGLSEKAFIAKLTDGIANLTIENLPDLPTGVANAAGTVAGNKIYIAGGETATGVVSSFLCLDLSAAQSRWKKLADLPQAVSHTMLVAQSYKNETALYLIGGRRKERSGISEFFAAVYRYNIKTDTWESCASLPYPLSAHTGVTNGTQQILVLGGDKGLVFGKVEKALVAIEKETDAAKKAQLIKEKNEWQHTHPGFSREILVYNTDKDIWENAGSLPFPTPVTTQAFTWGKDIVLPSGEIKAGVRSPDIRIGKITDHVKKK